MVRKQREMSRREFSAALKRHGFRQVLMWFEDTSGQTKGVSIGGLFSMQGKLLRRATLAKIVKDRSRHAEQQSS